MNELASMLMQVTGKMETNWVALSGFLGVISLISSIVAGLILALIVRPVVQNAKDDLTAKINAAVKDVKDSMVSKEVFEQFEKNDHREHQAMERQIAALFEGNK